MTHRIEKKPVRVALFALALIAATAAVVAISQTRGSSTAEATNIDNAFAVIEAVEENDVSALPQPVEERLERMVAGYQVRNHDVKAALTGLGREENSEAGSITLATIGNDVCAFLEDGLGNCAERQFATAGRAFSAAPEGCGSYQVLGIVPDGIENVTIQRAGDGSTIANLPVGTNAYVGSLPAERLTAVGVDETGMTVFETPLPLDEYLAMNEGCG